MKTMPVENYHALLNEARKIVDNGGQDRTVSNQAVYNDMWTKALRGVLTQTDVTDALPYLSKDDKHGLFVELLHQQQHRQTLGLEATKQAQTIDMAMSHTVMNGLIGSVTRDRIGVMLDPEKAMHMQADLMTQMIAFRKANGGKWPTTDTDWEPITTNIFHTYRSLWDAAPGEAPRVPVAAPARVPGQPQTAPPAKAAPATKAPIGPPPATPPPQILDYNPNVGWSKSRSK